MNTQKYVVTLSDDAGTSVEVTGTSIDTEDGELRIAYSHNTVAIFGKYSWAYVREVR